MSEVFRESGFAGLARFEVARGEVVERSIDDVVAATFSLSSAAPHLFGLRRPEFEAQLRKQLQKASDHGLFCERIRDVALDVWRTRADPR